MFNKRLSTTFFIISQVLILVIGLLSIGYLYYVINLQYPISAKPFSEGPVTAPPKTLRIELNHPDDLILSFENSVVVSGQTAPGQKVLIFSDSEDLIIESEIDGSFSTVLDLEEGVNTITAVTFDASGDSRSVERTVYYSKEKI